MWLLLGTLALAAVTFILHPVSTLVGLGKIAAFSVAAVSALALRFGADPALYVGPAIIGAIVWIALCCIPTRRLA